MVSLIRLTYVSERDNWSPGVLDNILRVSEVHNKTHGITGALIATDSHFAQVLEGDPVRVTGLMTRIGGDARHRRVQLGSVNHIRRRLFPIWSMRVFAGNDIPAMLVNPQCTAARVPLSDWAQPMIYLMFRRLARALNESSQ